MQCTSCNSDNVQRLSVIYKMGTQQINTTSHTTGVGGGFGSGFGGGLGTARTNTHGTSQTLIAQQVAPPEKKKYTGAVLFGLAGLILSVAMPSPSMGIMLILVGGVMGYLANKYNSETWPPAVDRWKRSWHCNKCGEVYLV